ncbi:MAG TPA: hypothetical protein VFO76_01010 [Candidatus Kapabacteria bacterium]|nr:hypothetical protein [Candidatus Kapabacteria bacterium]
MKKKMSDKKLSLHPLSAEEALIALLQIPPLKAKQKAKAKPRRPK